MTSTAHSIHLPALEQPHQRAEVGGQLPGLLVEMVDLSLLGKQPHSNAVGPLFSPLREVHRGELEDRVVVHEVTRRLAEVAERARERMDRPGDMDAATQDVVIEVVGAPERQLLMIRAQFRDGSAH